MAIDVPTATDTDAAALAEAVATARAAFARGLTRPIAWRERQLDALLRLLDEGEEAILDAVATDLGKPRIEGWIAEVAFTRGEVALARKHLARWARPRRVSLPLTSLPGKGRIVPEPLGTVLVMAPWNYPVQLLLAPLAVALAAGNSVVLKPSELTPATSAVVADLVARHLDPEAVQVVEGGPEVSQELLSQRWDHIFFTGSTKVGRVVMEAAARHLTPVTLELGGKSPAIVDASADLAVAARRIAWGKFLNAGQTCIAPDHVLVHADAHDELVAHLVEAVRAFYGEDPRTSPDYARIVNQRHHARLVGLLDGSGEVAVGGDHDADTCYLAPTVLVGTGPDAPVMADEIFGPILPVLAVPSIEDAVAAVNSRPKPLALYVFAQDDEVVDRVLDATSSGGVCVNHTILHITPPDLPFGGVGPSGMGRYHGRSGFDTFSNLKSVLRKGTRPDPNLMYPPYTETKARIIRRAL
jgi:aldehyde dehydrogenase (NAD+)